jgi:hypothetical protein
VYEVKSSMCLPRAAERAWNHPFLSRNAPNKPLCSQPQTFWKASFVGRIPLVSGVLQKHASQGTGWQRTSPSGMENLPTAGAPSNPGRLPTPGHSWQLALVSGLLMLSSQAFHAHFADVPMPPSVGIRRSASVGASVGIPLSWLPTQRGNVSMVSASASVTELNVTLRRVGRQNAAHTWEGMGLASSTLAATPCHFRLPSIYRGWLGYGAGRRAELL